MSNDFITRLKSVNFKDRKYVLSLILYFASLLTGYFIFDLFFNTTTAEIPDKNMKTMDSLNPDLPDAKIKNNDIEGKYESMLKSYGRIDDFSAVDNIERNGNKDEKEGYESQYDDGDLAAIEANKNDTTTTETATDRLRDINKRLEANKAQAKSKFQQGSNNSNANDDYTPMTPEERQRQAMEELNRALAQARLNGQNSAKTSKYDDSLPSEVEKAVADATKTQQKETESSTVKTTTNRKAPVSTIDTNAPKKDDSRKAVKAIDENQEASEVVKKVEVASDYFNTIATNEPERKLIKAIIDEDVKAVDGSRVRLRLLDGIVIDNVEVPKGSYIYATMNGFGSQRVKGEIKSILIGDDLVKVNLSIYDTDGLEGLYVPSSNFRDTSKDVASGAMTGSTNISSNTNNGNVLSQWGVQALNNAYQKTTNAISKSIKKNSAKLKYGTFVYLVNTKEKKNNR